MDLKYLKNEDEMKQISFRLSEKKKVAHLGGGQKKIDAHHAKGKLTARERIAYLTDDDSDFLEIGTFVGEGMYKEVGGCPSEIGRAHV
jgi:acetyl-CoA carboxylase carboxyltransferase component